ncbi:Host factor-I protein [Piscirickettsia salmonis]|uniref:RNA chaperone Hfq n=2 Tax=Piscirickettsia salmonis TaxID=1238 RepID=A0A1L6TEC7_PISSA|nr:RNA chaperone Hfq [Piscirickettsia salmonis]AKP72688.1 RNA chaperone Hfq [Piscirickettsia salmonis LF-89 = ATCC VR-1361]ALB23813.1 RNA chaperone Hfq [Piscirickettsia salmonis]ALY03658.1 RNA chaperone Hfq [Piscirickettsia salmonis]AMA43220.1 RNA chaperone Hfq [Piscirickettsia salmonis]AOS35690.1 RNA chaperone Hfq [Piscirickettsia salmonis]
MMSKKDNDKQQSISCQDKFIEQLIEKGEEVNIFLIGGQRITGKIIQTDRFIVMIEDQRKSPMMIYKHAVSTICEQGYHKNHANTYGQKRRDTF